MEAAARIWFTPQQRAELWERWKTVTMCGGHWKAFRQCPLYPRKWTLLTVIGMSALCQKQTLATSIDHLVGQQLHCV